MRYAKKKETALRPGELAQGNEEMPPMHAKKNVFNNVPEEGFSETLVQKEQKSAGHMTDLCREQRTALYLLA